MLSEGNPILQTGHELATTLVDFVITVQLGVLVHVVQCHGRAPFLPPEVLRKTASGSIRYLRLGQYGNEASMQSQVL